MLALRTPYARSLGWDAAEAELCIAEANPTLYVSVTCMIGTNSR
jgi:hypothetical protein